MSVSPKRLLYGGLAAFVALVAVYGISTLNGAKPAFEASRLSRAERGTMVLSVVATGKIEPVSEVEIKSKANGIIERLYVDVGDLVHTGQLLAELDKVNLEARLREARANLQAAEAARGGAEAQLHKTTVEAEGPEVEFAKRAYDRARQLFEERLAPQSVLDDARSAYEVASNRQRAAQSALAIARSKVAEAAAVIAQARAAVERAEEELRNATIRAPIRGTVLTRDVEVGSAVSSILNLGANATLVMTIGDIDEVFVRGKVDESDIGRVRVGQAAHIAVETFKDRSFEGHVTRISPIGVEKDNVTTFEVEVSIRNPGRELRANMTANAEIVLEEHAGSLIVPESAVIYDAQKQPYVDLLAPSDPSGRRRVPVKVGVGNGTKTQILEGLKEGDTVVLPG
jgi:HlyD family secretion protein